MSRFEYSALTVMDPNAAKILTRVAYWLRGAIAVKLSETPEHSSSRCSAITQTKAAVYSNEQIGQISTFFRCHVATMESPIWGRHSPGLLIAP